MYRIDVSSFKCLVEFIAKIILAFSFLCGNILITTVNIIDVELLRFYDSFCVSFCKFSLQGICPFHLCCRIYWHILDLLTLYHRSLRHCSLFFNLFSLCSSDWIIYMGLLPSSSFLQSSLTCVISTLLLILSSEFCVSDIVFFCYTISFWSFKIISTSLLRFKIFILCEHIFLYVFENNYHSSLDSFASSNIWLILEL